MSAYNIYEGEDKVNELIASYKAVWAEREKVFKRLNDTPSKVQCGIFGLFSCDNKERERLWSIVRELEKKCSEIGKEIVGAILDTKYGGILFSDFGFNRPDLSVYPFHDGFEVCRPPDEFMGEDDEVTLLDFKLDKSLSEQIVECAEENVRNRRCDVDIAKSKLSDAERCLQFAEDTLEKVKDIIRDGYTA